MDGNNIVLCTGNPGSGRDEYIQKMLQTYGASQDIKYYHLYDYLLKHSKSEGFNLNKQTILDFAINKPREIERIRELAIVDISTKTKDKGSHIISTPYSFEWNGELIYGLTEEDVRKINPDTFIVIIDDIVRVKARLKKDSQWAEKEFYLSELAKWRRTEIEGTLHQAHLFDPPRKFYVVAIENNPRVLFELITNLSKKRIYLSYPITGVNPEEVNRCREFGKQLEDFFIVFDPLTIKEWTIVSHWKDERDKARERGIAMPPLINCELEYSSGTEKYECNSEEIRHAIKDIRHQIVRRDYMLIESADFVVAYHPRKQISAGVVCEMIRGKTYGKNVYVMYPYEPSPFLEFYSHRIFQDQNKFIDFLKIAAE